MGLLEPVTPKKLFPSSEDTLQESATHVGADVPTPTLAVTTDALALEPGTQVAEYRIEGVIGEGGMGVVMAARHPVIGKRAAIKILKRELCSDPLSVRRFVDEARVVNEIGHPNIVDIFAFGEMPDGRCYFVMEWLKGESLRDRISRAPVTLDEIRAVLKALARALDAAHDASVIHRDLKPDNVFLVDVRGEAPSVKLLDFGIAKLQHFEGDVTKTATGMIVGTPQYIAPEQARGHAIDHRVDIYSLGAIAFECLTGRPPFVCDNAMEMVAMHLMEPAPRPSALRDNIPPVLDELVHAMLAKEPNDRPSLGRVCAVMDELASYRPSAPSVPAVDHPPAARSRRWIALPIGVVLAITAVALVLHFSTDSSPASEGVPAPAPEPTVAPVPAATPPTVAPEPSAVPATASAPAADLTQPKVVAPPANRQTHKHDNRKRTQLPDAGIKIGPVGSHVGSAGSAVDVPADHGLFPHGTFTGGGRQP